MHTPAVAYIDYEHFDNKVAGSVSGENYHAFKHLLPTVGLLYRNRFLQTMQYCTNIQNSIQLLTTAKNLPDVNYFRYLRYALKRLQ